MLGLGRLPWWVTYFGGRLDKYLVPLGYDGKGDNEASMVSNFPAPHLSGLAFCLAKTPALVLKGSWRGFTSLVLRTPLAHFPLRCCP